MNFTRKIKNYSYTTIHTANNSALLQFSNIIYFIKEKLVRLGILFIYLFLQRKGGFLYQPQQEKDECLKFLFCIFSIFSKSIISRRTWVFANHTNSRISIMDAHKKSASKPSENATAFHGLIIKRKLRKLYSYHFVGKIAKPLIKIIQQFCNLGGS